MSSTDRLGFEWDKYSSLDSNYEKQFKNWIYPLDPNDFKNKSMLDDYFSKRADNRKLIWSLMVFEMWREKWL